MITISNLISVYCLHSKEGKEIFPAFYATKFSKLTHGVEMLGQEIRSET